MLKYTLGIIVHGDKVLLLNRNSAAWMGAWNGVGGKLEPGERPSEGMCREIKEETGLNIHSVIYKGVVTWWVDRSYVQGMYLYKAALPPEQELQLVTPLATVEGILDWKDAGWVQHPDNVGVAYYLPKSLSTILYEQGTYEHRCFYEGGRLVQHEIRPIPAASESDQDLLTQVEQAYLKSR